VKPFHAANGNLKDDLIRRTRQVWQPRLGRNLSGEDARQIAENITGFFSVLVEWSRAERSTPANGSAYQGQTTASGLKTMGNPPGKGQCRCGQEVAHLVKSNKNPPDSGGAP
jgi:hypothetical protein